MRIFLLATLVFFPLRWSVAAEQTCFLVIDSTTGKEVARQGGNLCAKRYPACSTFKVPLSLIAFQEGLLKDAKTILKWDGVKREIPSWDQDQFASQWMERSVVWFSQRLTPQLGERKLTRFLSEFKFGTADLSGGITEAWLTTPGHKSTLLISAEEQAAFFRRFWRGELTIDKHAVEVTKSILPVTEVEGGKMLGKTGSGYWNGSLIGWYVAHLTRNGKDYDVASLLIRDLSTRPDYYGGPLARTQAIDLLKKIKLP